MSRSRTPIVGHTTCGSEREDKKLWHRAGAPVSARRDQRSPEALSPICPAGKPGQQRLVDGQGWPLLLAVSARPPRRIARQSQGRQERASLKNLLTCDKILEISRHLFKLSC
jgi:hypothetical protein